MKSKLLKARKQLILISLMASYVWGVALGSFVHNILHHLSLNAHLHSLPCLAEGLAEVPLDEAHNFSPNIELTASACDFKLALSNLSRPLTKGPSQISPGRADLLGETRLQWPRLDLIQRVYDSSLSSRGPPVHS